jgi:hypothetical protein
VMEAQMDYAEINRRLAELLSATKHLLSPHALAHAKQFLEVGEPELALETIAAALAGQKVGPEIVRMVRDLAKAMELLESVSYQMFWRTRLQVERA